MMGEDRVGDDRDPRHRPAEFQQTAPHVVPAGHQPQAAIALVVHPGRGLPGVALSVVGLLAEHDAAGLALGGRAQRAQQHVAIDPRIDAGNEQLFGLPLAEQRQPGFQPQASAGQHHDRIGRAVVSTRTKALLTMKTASPATQTISSVTA